MTLPSVWFWNEVSNRDASVPYPTATATSSGFFSQTWVRSYRISSWYQLLGSGLIPFPHFEKSSASRMVSFLLRCSLFLLLPSFVVEKLICKLSLPKRQTSQTAFHPNLQNIPTTLCFRARDAAYNTVPYTLQSLKMFIQHGFQKPLKCSIDFSALLYIHLQPTSRIWGGLKSYPGRSTKYAIPSLVHVQQVQVGDRPKVLRKERICITLNTFSPLEFLSIH